MTQVFAGRGGGQFCLRARGHATYEGPPGDGGQEARLVPVQACAYLSGILYSLAGYLANAQARGEARVVCSRLESGDALLCFRGDEGVRGAYEMALIGLKQLEKACPELVRVTEEKFFEKFCLLQARGPEQLGMLGASPGERTGLFQKEPVSPFLLPASSGGGKGGEIGVLRASRTDS